MAPEYLGFVVVGVAVVRLALLARNALKGAGPARAA